MRKFRVHPNTHPQDEEKTQYEKLNVALVVSNIVTLLRPEDNYLKLRHPVHKTKIRSNLVYVTVNSSTDYVALHPCKC